MTMLDTNLVSAFLKRDAATKTPQFFAFVSDLLRAEGLSISFVTQYELRRGVEELVRRGEGRSKRVALEKFLDRVEVLGLDSPGGRGWNLAARMWADGLVLKPAQVFSDADLMIAATAVFHGHTLATGEKRLAEGLSRIGFPGEVRVVAGA